MLIKRMRSPFNARQKDCIEICKRRSEAGMTCYYCIYRDSKTCEGIKQGYQVAKPKQIIFY